MRQDGGAEFISASLKSFRIGAGLQAQNQLAFLPVLRNLFQHRCSTQQHYAILASPAIAGEVARVSVAVGAPWAIDTSLSQESHTSQRRPFRLTAFGTY